MFVRVERQHVHGISDLAWIQVLDAVLGAENDVPVIVDGVLGKVDVAIEVQEARHEFVGGVGIFGEFGVRDHSERDEQGFDVDEQREDAIATSEAAPQRGLGEHLHGPTLFFQNVANVFQDHRGLSSEFFALRQCE